MPIRSRDDAVEVESHVKSIFDASADRRAAEVRSLFVETLDFTPAFGEVELKGAPGTLELPGQAERIAELGGFHVLYVALGQRDNRPGA